MIWTNSFFYVVFRMISEYIFLYLSLTVAPKVQLPLSKDQRTLYLQIILDFGLGFGFSGTRASSGYDAPNKDLVFYYECLKFPYIIENLKNYFSIIK